MPNKKSKPSPSFEEAISELEEIVNALEHHQLPLEELISHYERGAALHLQCESFLCSAKKRLETIAQTKSSINEQPTSKDKPTSSNNNIQSDDDEIRLF